MSSQRIVYIGFEAAIPVGHRVELRHFGKDVGVFSTKIVSQTDEPLVTDLDTGIVYGVDWHYQNVVAYQQGTPLALQLEVRADISETARITGRVAACRVTRIGSGDSSFTQTTLAIEALPPAEVYR